jgi:hypothetical protein
MLSFYALASSTVGISSSDREGHSGKAFNAEGGEGMKLAAIEQLVPMISVVKTS